MKKTFKVIGISLIILVILALIFFTVDYIRVQKQEKPIFCISNPAGIYNDGGTIEYFGLGYKIIDFNMLNGYDEMKIGSWAIQYDDFSDEFKEYDNMFFTKKALVMEVYENSLGVMEILDNEKAGTIYSVAFSKEGNIGFKYGQEVLIYFDGMIADSYPAQIYNVGKIEIVKDKSNITIPDNVIRYYNNTEEKVSINVSDLSNTGITLTITDENELPYEYSDDYIIYQEVKNKEYTGIGYKIGEDTENSTSGYTGTGLEYIWEEMRKNSEIKIEDTIENLVYNLPNMEENEHYTVIGKKIDWTNLYGKLNDGKYRLVFSGEASFPIIIEFSIDNEQTEILKIEIAP